MSLLKRKELAKSKSELGNKIKYVNNLIKQHKIGQETSQSSFEKIFKPVTSKLDDVIDSNLNLRMPQRRKKTKKTEVPNYGIDIDDEVEDMNLDDLFGDEVSPQQGKQLVPKPPTYEESLQDIMEGKKEIYVDPQYLPQDPKELPPEYDEDKEVDYTIDDYDLSNKILDDIGLQNYEDIDYQLVQQEMTPKKTRSYLKTILKNATIVRNQLKGKKSSVTKKYNSGNISEAERQVINKQIDDTRAVLNEYITHVNNEMKTIKGSGIKGRGRKKRGGNVMFFNDPKQLLNKLELIIGEVLAGNTSIQMRNMGVNILDTLLRMSTINRLHIINCIICTSKYNLCKYIIYIWIERLYYHHIMLKVKEIILLKISQLNSTGL